MYFSSSLVSYIQIRGETFSAHPLIHYHTHHLITSPSLPPYSPPEKTSKIQIQIPISGKTPSQMLARCRFVPLSCIHKTDREPISKFSFVVVKFYSCSLAEKVSFKLLLHLNPIKTFGFRVRMITRMSRPGL